MATVAERDRQVQQARELLFTGPQQRGFAKEMFFGRFQADWVFPYPANVARTNDRVGEAVSAITRFAAEHIDPAAIDRAADIPRAVINGLADLGVLGMTAPPEFGGRGFSQSAYCRILEVLGGRCSATSIFVNAHHSIGIRALLLFGTKEQKRRWLPPLVNGQELAAFALTEPEAGSDAANVQTTATPTEDGTHYKLNGQKRYITNAALANVLTVMARTPIPGREETAITAFLVTPDLPGFRVVEPRMEKLGIRGTATGRLEFHDMLVPRENILGPLGKGLKVALTVLDFGRTTFGACCTGMAKSVLRLAREHCRARRQFQRTLAEFELVQKKLAAMAAGVYAMEAMTYITANLIDRGLEDYMVETAMLKVYTTELLWRMVDDCFQLYGGSAYFTDQPLERILRDARINQIGEGANDVLRSFIALVGMRGPGEQLRDAGEAALHPWRGLGPFWRYARDRLAAVRRPDIPIQNSSLANAGRRLSRGIQRLGAGVQTLLWRYREEVLERQLQQERLAECAMEYYASACVLSRLDSDIQAGIFHDQPAAELFLQMSAKRAENWLRGIYHNLDDATLRAARALLDNASRD